MTTVKWKKKKLFLFSGITIGILFSILEITSRVIFYSKNRLFHNTIKIQGGPIQVSDDSLVFINQPFYLDYDRRFQFNEAGMKSEPGDELIQAKSSADFWVLLTGASAMEGMGSNRNGNWLDITGVDDHPYNKTIAFYLQEMLQKSMPQKKVKVFNAAFSTSRLCQSYWRYLQLYKKLQPDWVVSMDGVNDPVVLKPRETTPEVIKNEWQQNPQFKYPLKLIIQLTTHSAFINYMKQIFFHVKADGRLANAAAKNYPLRKQWAATSAGPITFADFNDSIGRAVDNFTMWLFKYDSVLNSHHQKHLLLLQLNMFLRDTSNLSETEQAVNHYYRQEFQDKSKHTFLREIYNRFSHIDSLHRNIITMESVHHWPGFVFVDYCHFSDEATKRIAAEIFMYINSDGHAPIFSNKQE